MAEGIVKRRVRKSTWQKAYGTLKQLRAPAGAKGIGARNCQPGRARFYAQQARRCYRRCLALRGRLGVRGFLAKRADGQGVKKACK